MIRIILIIICFLSSCSSKTNSEKKDVKNEKYVLLFSDTLKERHLDKKVNSLLEEIVNSNDVGKFDSIQKFVLLNEWYSCNGLFFLIDNNYRGLAQWINSNCGIISEFTWKNLPNEFGARAPKQLSTELQIALFNCMYNIKDVNDRGYNLNKLWETAGYECAKLAMTKLPAETESYIRTVLYTMLSRFNTPEFNSIIKMLITSKIEFDALELVLEFGFESYNRYDFLPELKKLEADLKKEKVPAKIGLQKSIMEQLATTIPVLEKKKLENAPIGLPLDWPGDGK
jgi:hypothetical protein